MLLEALPPMKDLHPGRYKSQGSVLWSLVLFVQDPQGVLLPGGSDLFPNGHHGAAQSPHVLIQSLPMREALGVTTSTNIKRSRCFLTWLRVVSEFSLITSQYGQKASCLHLPPMLIDCLTRHSCWWKFIKRNSLSVPSRTLEAPQLSSWVTLCSQRQIELPEDASLGRLGCTRGPSPLQQ